MKKLVIVAFAAAVAAVAQAGTVSWGSGALMTAAGSTGGWSSQSVSAAEAAVTLNVYLCSETDYNKYSAANSEAAYAWAQEQTADFTANSYNASKGSYAGAATASTTTLSASTKYYSIVVATYTDKTYGEMYMTKGVTFTTAANGSKSNTNLLGGTTGVKNWVGTVPEPTSGLLLLVGMAGLALRRRRA